VRYSPEQRQEHIARWQSSGLSKAAYCREHDIVYQTFANWTRPAADPIAATPDEFVQLADDRPRAQGADLRVELSGCTLAFAAGADPTWIASILERLTRC
jgi:transposase-like protein